MSPRGVVIPDVREQLFQATERLLMREDAAALSGRAVSREAGTAVGLLHNHFGDFDSFLAAFVLDRLRRSAATVEHLSDRVGEGTLKDNLNDTLAPLLGPDTRVLSRLAAARPSVLARAIDAHKATHHPGSMLQQAVQTYLQREQQLGRVAHDADVEAAATALVATVHQLLLMPTDDERTGTDLLGRVIVVVIGGIATGDSETSGPTSRKHRR